MDGTSRNAPGAGFRRSGAAADAPADGVDAQRRSVLWLGGWALLALPALLASWGCGPSESEDGAGTASAPGADAEASRTQPGGTAEPTAPSEAGGQAGEERLVTEIPSLASRVESLQYTHQTPKPEQRCDGCQFYQPERGGEGVGGCQLFQEGLVKAAGWCTSYVKRQT